MLKSETISGFPGPHSRPSHRLYVTRSRCIAMKCDRDSSEPRRSTGTQGDGGFEGVLNHGFSGPKWFDLGGTRGYHHFSPVFEGEISWRLSCNWVEWHWVFSFWQASHCFLVHPKWLTVETRMTRWFRRSNEPQWKCWTCSVWRKRCSIGSCIRRNILYTKTCFLGTLRKTTWC